MRDSFVEQEEVEEELYEPVHRARAKFLQVGSLLIHYNEWGNPEKPTLFLLHGWMDTGMSYQFIVDELEKDWHVVAPDWRGFGFSDWPLAQHNRLGRNYWFPDHLADLEGILDQLSRNEPARLVGHGMGGNLAMLYAGIRPNRVKSVVNLEGFGLPDMPEADAPKKYAKWLDDLKSPPQTRFYASSNMVANLMMKANKRLSREKALFLVKHLSRPAPQGWELLGDAAHRISSPFLYKLGEAQAVWKQITAPVLHVEAKQSKPGFFLLRRNEKVDLDQLRKRFETVPNWRYELVNDAGHMIHHDQPTVVAKLIEKHVPFD